MRNIWLCGAEQKLANKTWLTRDWLCGNNPCLTLTLLPWGLTLPDSTYTAAQRREYPCEFLKGAYPMRPWHPH